MKRILFFKVEDETPCLCNNVNDPVERETLMTKERGEGRCISFCSGVGRGDENKCTSGGICARKELRSS